MGREGEAQLSTRSLSPCLHGALRATSLGMNHTATGGPESPLLKTCPGCWPVWTAGPAVSFRRAAHLEGTNVLPLSTCRGRAAAFPPPHGCRASPRQGPAALVGRSHSMDTLPHFFFAGIRSCSLENAPKGGNSPAPSVIPEAQRKGHRTFL